MWAEIFKDVKTRKDSSKPPHEPCHYDNWERPSDRFATTKVPNEREATVSTNWSINSNTPSASNHQDESSSSEDNEQSDQEPLKEQLSEKDPEDIDVPSEYDKFWDSGSEAEDLEKYQSGNMAITLTNFSQANAKNEVSYKASPSFVQKSSGSDLVLAKKRIVETPKKVPLFSYPPGYERSKSSNTSKETSGFQGSSKPSGFAESPRLKDEDEVTLSKDSVPAAEQSKPDWSDDSDDEFEDNGGQNPFQFLSGRARASIRKSQGSSDKVPSLESQPTTSSKKKKKIKEPSSEKPRKRDDRWSESSNDEGVPNESKISESSDKMEKPAETAEKAPEKLESSQKEESLMKPPPTDPWYNAIEEQMKALVLQAASNSPTVDEEEERADAAGPGPEKLDVSKDEEIEEEEEPDNVDPEHLTCLIEQEHKDNIFSPFYNKTKKAPKVKNIMRPSTYKHHQAIQFAAKSNLWKTNWDRDLKTLPITQHKVLTIRQQEPRPKEVFAFYRVLAERQQKYILMACHVNVHGYHRGDLRFLEMNSKSKLKGFEESVMGNLFLGDILAVTELARNSSSRFVANDFQVSSVTQDSTCFWMVSKATLFPRTVTPEVTFSFVKNHMAVVKGEDEPMKVAVDDWKTIKLDSIYSGTAFKPIKLDDTFAESFMKSCKQQVIIKSLRIATYPNAFATIYHYEECQEQNEEFLIGTNAFCPSRNLDTEKREKIVETCSLMGFSAATTIFNGRFDCRAFRMQDIRKMGLTVKFRIDNPPGNPTLGLWCTGNRIRFGGPFGDVNATIETVIENNGLLQIASRMTRDCPKKMSFDEGDFFVSQREVPEPYFLYDGYFQQMTKGSNGKRIIETLYGGEPLEVLKEPVPPERLLGSDEEGSLVEEQKPVSKEPVQYFFPSIPDRLPLNKYQNEYVQMLLDGNPLVIGSSPFGCGKSMTIITAALEIYKRNSQRDLLNNQSHQLLITQSNFASVNLIEITKRICASQDGELKQLKVTRYVSEKNWNELSEHCRTDRDMPHLMKAVFKEWAIGGIPESDRRLKRIHNFHTKNMMAFLIKNCEISPDEFSETALRLYMNNPDPKPPIAGFIAEAFFILYQPDIIMTTADSSKSLLSLLKQVCTVQIDEASQLPEYTLLGLLKAFETANFGLIGDIHQLPPYCEDTLDGRLKEFGIGNTMERAIQGKLFPISTLRYVYRCHPKATQLLSELFYDEYLLSGIKEKQREEFMKSRPDFWPNANFPMMILNHTGNSFKMGTSTGNESEKTLVGRLVINLLSHREHLLKASDIGVISFYAAQTSILTEHLRTSGVKCGTIDAFQGTEKEVIIVCCTNSAISGFMQDKNRLNVALSRAKQATIIVGNLERLQKAEYWSTIVKRVEAYGNLRNANDPTLFNSHKPYCPPSSPQKSSAKGRSPKDSAPLVRNPYYMGNSSNRNRQSPSPAPGPSTQQQPMVRNPYYAGNHQYQDQRRQQDRYQDQYQGQNRQDHYQDRYHQDHYQQRHEDQYPEEHDHYRAPRDEHIRYSRDHRPSPRRHHDRDQYRDQYQNQYREDREPYRAHRQHRPSPPRYHDRQYQDYQYHEQYVDEREYHRPRDDVMQGRWNSTAHSYHRTDGYHHP